MFDKKGHRHRSSESLINRNEARDPKETLLLHVFLETFLVQSTQCSVCNYSLHAQQIELTECHVQMLRFPTTASDFVVRDGKFHERDFDKETKQFQGECNLNRATCKQASRQHCFSFHFFQVCLVIETYDCCIVAAVAVRRAFSNAFSLEPNDVHPSTTLQLSAKNILNSIANFS